ncbi:ATP-dependent nuclease [Citrobacter portucalensis]|uniref:ATP-dependent nuclease n=2 Tax=Citrobacter TaxID=544 RepID=UPI0002412843|nr:AAA family ATPase [Citrobacter portucalensis]RXM23431.1 ATP-dependent endonuclease [Citrobacter sp. AAK_AS5]EHL80059.1 hypothetical protein HMPREF9428_02422 [Citrobacter portucalensis]MCH2698925.1 AAA family ATPase [Citrobacter portucalensis]MDT7464972.1 AAA family ATPase [Citrobacter portucalensis]QGS15573.1 AAA family ATPase [Citrobacter portucalensis]
MHLSKLAVRNFRRLHDVVIDLASDISIFVGANNSGKTSVGHALQLFTGSGRFSIHDFSAVLWPDIVAFGEGAVEVSLPSMEVDLWFEVNSDDIHRVIDLLPSLSWQGSLVGIRVSYSPKNPLETRARYAEMRHRMLEAVARDGNGELIFDPSPHNLKEFLQDRLNEEYELRHFVLDPARYGVNMIAEENYNPLPLDGRDRSGREILNSLLRIDCLNAQRHLSDSPGGARSEELSRVLSRFYSRNLEQQSDDHQALSALAESETSFNRHLERVFEPTLRSLSQLGYPGLTNPRMVIRSALDPAQIMGGRNGAMVHYALGADDGNPNPPTLPDRYNGLGFKNLIFMVVELLDLHAQWIAIEDNRPPVHLIFIEEPEAHLHAQLQQAFIRKVMDILAVTGEEQVHYTNQVVVTSHSTHILYERGFRPIRYFRRSRSSDVSASEVLNMSIFYDNADPEVRDFLERYLRLTHCDLFFADAAVLVEGNVERLLMPQMIANAAPRLASSYLTVLEIGGAFGYRFRALIEFLGLTTLVITDLDSVYGPQEQREVVDTQPDILEVTAANDDDTELDDDEEDDQTDIALRPGKACIAGYPGAITSNQTLRQWLPRCATVSELWEAQSDQKIQRRNSNTDALVRVAYQCPKDVIWGQETMELTGRTLEEAFALENLEWCQHVNRKPLKLRIPRANGMDLLTLAMRIHKRVQAKSFGKTDFALALLSEDPNSWVVPSYIAEGLRWLETEIVSAEQNNGVEDGATQIGEVSVSAVTENEGVA